MEVVPTDNLVPYHCEKKSLIIMNLQNKSEKDIP